MINPISARITLPSSTVRTPFPTSYSSLGVGRGKDSFSFEANPNNANQVEAKSSGTILELLFGNISKKNKKPKTEHYNKFEADLYAKTNSEAELRQFMANYEAPFKL